MMTWYSWPGSLLCVSFNALTTLHGLNSVGAGIQSVSLELPHPTCRLPHVCFCTTSVNKEPKLRLFTLNAESCFANRHRKHIHIITWSQRNRPSFLQESAVRTKQDRRSEYSMLLSVTTHSSFTKSVVMSIIVSLGNVLCRASSEKSMDSIGGISYYLDKC